MRKYACVKNPGACDTGGGFEVKWCMLCQERRGGGVLLFLYDRCGDAFGCRADLWFAALEDAEACCAECYGIAPGDWTDAGDPLPHCQQDRLRPIRVAGRDVGKPRWGQYEILVDGAWVEWQPGT